MAPQLLKDLATHSRKWIIQCRVARKWIATNCNTGKVLHMDMVLLDSEGSDIWAMVPPLLISKFESSLKEQEVYEIRHFKVALTKNSFRPVPNRLMIEFDSATLVQHVQSVPKIPLHKFYFLKQADMMQKLYDKKNLSGDLCLSSTRATQLNSNLDIPEVHAFNVGKTTLTTPVLIAEVPPVEIPKISIAQLNDFKTMEEHTDKLFAIEGKVIQVRPNWCYMGCAVCPRKVEEDLEEYFCGHCKTTSSIAKAKFRVKLQVQDDIGEADFAILEHEGVRFFGVMADVLFQSNQRQKEPITLHIQQVLNMTLKLHVRLTQFNFSNPQAEYSVASVDHDPLQQVTKIPDPVSVGGSSSCGLKRKHDDDADPVEE
ncbi:unnamed protein product [Linum tenue]|uniref:Replication factor A C-terminal domain-containing protein n=1 Tax=Linum tenue TaxID=586396 RepID=A0AAV0RYR2_9ROSI|nr:unnamed protein product [Linum tenue]